jgi:PDZ domain-containing protein
MRTLIVAAVLFITALVLLVALPVPYVILSPGPTYNTLGEDSQGNEIIVIKGTTVDATTGHLNMTTVNVTTGPITGLQALLGWLNTHQEVVPHSAVYPPGKSVEQVNEQNSADFAASQDSATAAASCELGYPKAFGVLSVTPDGPSAGKLQAGDVFVSIDGQPADTYDKLTTVMKAETPGKTVPVVVTRQGATVTEQIKLGPPPEGRTGATLGVQINDGTTCLAPFEVDLGLGNQIGGPSAGLMFALGIMEKVGTTDLTHGRFIAGTGTIDNDGNVGAIGGIQLKMIAARDAGATVFLAPADNCPDVVGATPKGLEVIKVNTLHNAVQDLEALQNGKPVPTC